VVTLLHLEGRALFDPLEVDAEVLPQLTHSDLSRRIAHVARRSTQDSSRIFGVTSMPFVSGPIGQPVRRKEDDRLLRGRGRFSDDLSLPGQVHAAIVRSPHPHARIVAIEVESARAMPGVLGIFTGADVAQDGLGVIPHNPVPANRHDLKLRAPGGGAIFFGPHVLLPADKARHVGDAVAMVVAETRAQAEDAAEAVRVTWDPLAYGVSRRPRPARPATARTLRGAASQMANADSAEPPMAIQKAGV